MKDITTSTLLSQILRHHAGYGGSAGRAGLVAFPRSLLMQLMERYPEQQVIAMADHVSKDVMVDIMAVLKGSTILKVS